MIYVGYGDAHDGMSIHMPMSNFNNDYTYIHSECIKYTV